MVYGYIFITVVYLVFAATLDKDRKINSLREICTILQFYMSIINPFVEEIIFRYYIKNE